MPAGKLGNYLRYRQPVIGIVAGLALLGFTVHVLVTERNRWDLAIFFAVLGVMGLAVSIYLFRHVRRGGPITLAEELERAPTPSHAARTLRQSMWVIGGVFGLYAAFVAYQLVQLEYGWASSVTLWEPIADIYGSFGFWPAVSAVPGAGLLLIVSLAQKLRALKERQTGRI